MAKAPAFQFYPSDWQRDLDDHPLEIEGAWIRICCRLYWTEGKATKSLDEWSRILRKKPKETEKIFQYFSSKNICDLLNQNGEICLTSRRMVRDAYIRKIRKLSGIQGGNPNLKPSQNQNNLLNQTVNQNPTPSSSSSSSDLNNTPPTPRKRGMVYADDFLQFWEAYPKKVGKDAALRAWKARAGTRPALAVLVSAIERQAQSDQWQKENGQFIPNPATWLNQGRWADEINSSVGSIDAWARKKQAEMENNGTI